ncbi:uncharacterized protein G2W53_045220 [Senna tora]|uniref:Uncharacterized protein n=1 Tax=Senna tora TaxID=362788 RepID=A0A834VXF3_9FABA|nr:uncharacterized protein G2W53_045220 [Senna tora]
MSSSVEITRSLLERRARRRAMQRRECESCCDAVRARVATPCEREQRLQRTSIT